MKYELRWALSACLRRCASLLGNNPSRAGAPCAAAEYLSRTRISFIMLSALSETRIGRCAKWIYLP